MDINYPSPCEIIVIASKSIYNIARFVIGINPDFMADCAKKVYNCS